MKKLMIIAMMLTLTSCGWMNRELSSITGDAYETCHKGVTYLQFTSGSTVAVRPNGKPLTCIK